ncbi:MAG: Flp pilus assembly complex ATPase component TadA [Oscillospiraceae bacterium]|nr:Flp pilus assembly complex ATPase component TadA [Oscillospiraceae bacterium]
MINKFNEVLTQTGERLKGILTHLDPRLKDDAREIRLRVGSPIALTCKSGQIMLHQFPLADRELIDSVYCNLCKYSVYSCQNQITEGFISLSGGHRAGICGTAVTEGGAITAIRDITSINIRIAGEYIGCSNEIICTAFSHSVCGLLLAGAPATGKTTLLRDIARQLSERNMRVTLIDERGELSGIADGVIGSSLGDCCDVFFGYPKEEAILQSIRCMSPEVIVCDEIGTEKEVRAISSCMNSGVSVICSVHAGDVYELSRKRQAVEILLTGAIEKVAILRKNAPVCTLDAVINTEVILSEISRSDYHTDGDLLNRLGHEAGHKRAAYTAQAN